MEKDFEMRLLMAMAKTQKKVDIITINGYQMRNVIILDASERAILISEMGIDKIVYKNAISTIVF